MRFVIQNIKIRLSCWVFAFGLFGCIHPKVGLKKSRLVDPMMDPAIASTLGDTMSGSIQGQFEKAVVGSGSVGGGSCPTCK